MGSIGDQQYELLMLCSPIMTALGIFVFSMFLSDIMIYCVKDNEIKKYTSLIICTSYSCCKNLLTLLCKSLPVVTINEYMKRRYAYAVWTLTEPVGRNRQYWHEIIVRILLIIMYNVNVSLIDKVEMIKCVRGVEACRVNAPKYKLLMVKREKYFFSRIFSILRTHYHSSGFIVGVINWAQAVVVLTILGVRNIELEYIVMMNVAIYGACMGETFLKPKTYLSKFIILMIRDGMVIPQTLTSLFFAISSGKYSTYLSLALICALTSNMRTQTRISYYTRITLTTEEFDYEGPELLITTSTHKSLYRKEGFGSNNYEVISYYGKFGCDNHVLSGVIINEYGIIIMKGDIVENPKYTWLCKGWCITALRDKINIKCVHSGHILYLCCCQCISYRSNIKYYTTSMRFSESNNKIYEKRDYRSWVEIPKYVNLRKRPTIY